jgi:hypothetical protein
MGDHQQRRVTAEPARRDNQHTATPAHGSGPTPADAGPSGTPPAPAPDTTTPGVSAHPAAPRHAAAVTTAPDAWDAYAAGDPYPGDPGQDAAEPVPDLLAARLRAAAYAHQPDRTRMWARVERGMAEPAGGGAVERGRRTHRAGRLPASGPAPWPRVVGVTAALAGAVALSAVASGLTTGGGGEPRTVVVTSAGPAEPMGSPVAAPSSSALVDATSRPASGDATVSPPDSGSPSGSDPTPSPGSATPGGGTGHSSGTRGGSHPASGRPGTGGTAAGGSGATAGGSGSVATGTSTAPNSTSYWSESDMTLRSTETVTGLRVVLRIARTDGLESTGSWCTLPGDGYTASVHQDGGALVYEWDLLPGHTVAAGSQTFAAQFRYASGTRDASGDTYQADITTHSGTTRVHGKLS